LQVCVSKPVLSSRTHTAHKTRFVLSSPQDMSPDLTNIVPNATGELYHNGNSKGRWRTVRFIPPSETTALYKKLRPLWSRPAISPTYFLRTVRRILGLSNYHSCCFSKGHKSCILNQTFWFWFWVHEKMRQGHTEEKGLVSLNPLHRQEWNFNINSPQPQNNNQKHQKKNTTAGIR